MKTVEIVKELLDRVIQDTYNELGACVECGEDVGHKTDCKRDEVVKAAKTYLRLMYA